MGYAWREFAEIHYGSNHERENMTTAIFADFQPLKMHKNLVIRVLRDHPEDLSKVSPEWDGTAEEFCAALEADPRQWIVDGVLSDWTPDA